MPKFIKINSFIYLSFLALYSFLRILFVRFYYFLLFKDKSFVTILNRIFLDDLNIIDNKVK
jgi:hypothetical protein